MFWVLSSLRSLTSKTWNQFHCSTYVENIDEVGQGSTLTQIHYQKFDAACFQHLNKGNTQETFVASHATNQGYDFTAFGTGIWSLRQRRAMKRETHLSRSWSSHALQKNLVVSFLPRNICFFAHHENLNSTTWEILDSDPHKNLGNALF